MRNENDSEHGVEYEGEFEEKTNSVEALDDIEM